MSSPSSLQISYNGLILVIVFVTFVSLFSCIFLIIACVVIAFANVYDIVCVSVCVINYM